MWSKQKSRNSSSLLYVEYAVWKSRRWVTRCVNAVRWHKCNTSTGMTTLPGFWTGQSRNSMDLMSQKNGMSTSQNRVIETANIKLLWDFTIQTDREIQARRPDIILVNRKENEYIVIDIAVPGDASIADIDKEKEKIQKYQDIRREIAHQNVCGSSGGWFTRHGYQEPCQAHWEDWNPNKNWTPVLKAALLGSARLLKNVLEAKGCEIQPALNVLTMDQQLSKLRKK